MNIQTQSIQDPAPLAWLFDAQAELLRAEHHLGLETKPVHRPGSQIVCRLSGLTIRIDDGINLPGLELDCHPLFTPRNAKALRAVLTDTSHVAHKRLLAGAILAAYQNLRIMRCSDLLVLKVANGLLAKLSRHELGQLLQGIEKEQHPGRRPAFRLEAIWEIKAAQPTKELLYRLRLRRDELSQFQDASSLKESTVFWGFGQRAIQTRLTKIPKGQSFSPTEVQARSLKLIRQLAQQEGIGKNALERAAKLALLPQIGQLKVEVQVELRSYVASILLATKDKLEPIQHETLTCYLAQLDQAILAGPTIDF